MKLEAILALCRPADASTTELAAAVRNAEASRRELLAQAEAADLARRDVLADDRTLAAAEKDGAASRLAAERIAAVLTVLRTDLDQAKARDARAELLKEYSEVEQKIANLRRWQNEDLPEIKRLIGVGLQVQDAAAMALEAFKSNVASAYELEAMRDGGELGVKLSSWGPELPRLTFPTWSLS